MQRLAGQIPKQQPVEDRTGEGDEDPDGFGG